MCSASCMMRIGGHLDAIPHCMSQCHWLLAGAARLRLGPSTCPQALQQDGTIQQAILYTVCDACCTCIRLNQVHQQPVAAIAISMGGPRHALLHMLHITFKDVLWSMPSSATYVEACPSLEGTQSRTVRVMRRPAVTQPLPMLWPLMVKTSTSIYVASVASRYRGDPCRARCPGSTKHASIATSNQQNSRTVTLLSPLHAVMPGLYMQV
jgi:hypothetical protein